MMPRRIQRQRTKGWRMPPGAVYVGRPTKWGNPYQVSQTPVGTWQVESSGVFPTWADAARYATTLFSGWFTNPGLDGEQRVAEARAELVGYDLACWCPPGQPCHADVLLEIANTSAADRCSACGGPGANPLFGWRCAGCRPVYQHPGDLAPQTGATR